MSTAEGLSRRVGDHDAVAGVATQPEQVRLRIGVVLPEASLDPKQIGRELLEPHAQLYGLTRAESRRRAEQLASLVDIGDAL